MRDVTLPTIYAGASWKVKLTWTNPDGSAVNLTGCSALIQIRNLTDVLLVELSTSNGKITFDSTQGVIYLALNAASTVNLKFNQARWDFVVTESNGDIMRLIGGTISAVAMVSHG